MSLVSDKESEFDFLEALSLTPRESLALVSKETLGLPSPTATIQKSGVNHRVSVRHRGPSPEAIPKTKTLSPFPTDARMVPVKKITEVSSSAKAQIRCLESCRQTTKTGDKTSIRLLEVLTSVKSMPAGLDDLAHGFLDTCQVLFTLQAGLDECIKKNQLFPGDLLSELEKKFRVTSTDFALLEQMLAKWLTQEGKGAMGKMKRGWGKMFGEADFEKMTWTLARNRETLRMSALIFRWNLGDGVIESGLGIGYTGLAAALNRLDERSGRASVQPPESMSLPSIASASVTNLRPQQSPVQEQPPLPPLPWAERSSSLAETRALAGFASPQTSPTAVFSIESHDRSVFSGANGSSLDRTSAFDETLSQTDTCMSDELLEEIAGHDLRASKILRIEVEPEKMPRWKPRNPVPNASHLQAALLSALRSKNHQHVEALLDQGAPPNSNALIEAARSRDEASMKLLLQFGGDANAASGVHVSPLLAAVQGTFISGALQLLQYGADPNMPAGPSLESPLAAAISSNNLRMTHLLLIHAGDPNDITADGKTLLISSINRKTSPQLVKLLVEFGANPNAKSRVGRTALFESIEANRPDLVATLLDNGAQVNLPGPKHILWPSTYHSECLEIVLKAGADLAKASGVLELASSINNLESIRLLLKAGCDVNARKDNLFTPLCSSIRDDTPAVFKLLLEAGADPNLKASEYPAFKCVTHDRIHFLPALVAAGANLRSPPGIVETAVSVDNMKALVWLLDNGLNPNDKAEGTKATPLTTAIEKDRIHMVDLLLSRGADPNLKGGQNWPICLAVHHPPILKRLLSVLTEPRAYKGIVEMAVTANQLESVKLLVESGVSVEDKRAGVFSPLTSAVKAGYRDIFDYLLSKGARVNSPGEHLPLVKALRRFDGKDTYMIETLLAAGADPGLAYMGYTALMEAVQLGNVKILRLLIQGGVDLEARDESGRNIVEMADGWDEGVAELLDAARRT